ncbi:hypothetical protein DR62_06045 [Burkholderia thailandensis]|nr:hypothetical protein DR62_06045 [Burkholderia thailandensis]AOI50492.1 hypothetical protein WI24_00885 [Burkholderia thailandensis]AOJ46771.1 hypothetical protein WJ27_17765 [Burkholderia thailandensis]AOJ49530.1 hypothetical protein AQ475_00870 [Burkholderia thailandensis]AOJ55247.1 hypothetical protein AQ477_01085 [Burkholderia thailandensis]
MAAYKKTLHLTSFRHRGAANAVEPAACAANEPPCRNAHAHVAAPRANRSACGRPIARRSVAAVREFLPLAPPIRFLI